MRIDLCFACDENYAPYAAVVLRSVWQTRKPEETFRVWFISDGITDERQAWIRRLFPKMEIHFRALPAGFMAGAPVVNKYLTRAAYARLAMGSLLPAYVSRVIYLDCDVLVRVPLGKLWAFDLNGKTAAGVEDWGVWFWRRSGEFVFPCSAAYLSSGLLLVDLKKWRETCAEARLCTYARAPKYIIRFEDQDVLNFALCGELGTLPAKWDVVLHLSREELSRRGAPQEWKEALEKPYVIHFATSNKPWKAECYLPYAEEFQAHMRALGIPIKRMNKLKELGRYWWKHPVFFFRPKFWKTWRREKWRMFL